jgi:hypothetical protein
MPISFRHISCGIEPFSHRPSLVYHSDFHFVASDLFALINNRFKMPIPREHSELHNVLGCALFDSRLVGQFAPYDMAHKICDAIAPEGRITRKGTLTAAFKGSGEEMNYPIYNALNNEDGDAKKLGMKKGTVMAICNYQQGKNNRCFMVGGFIPDEEGQLDIPTRKEVIEFAKKGFPNSRYSTQEESQFNIPKFTLDAYHAYVMKQFLHLMKQ